MFSTQNIIYFGLLSNKLECLSKLNTFIFFVRKARSLPALNLAQVNYAPAVIEKWIGPVWQNTLAYYWKV